MVALLQLMQPKNVVEVPQVFLQCISCDVKLQSSLQMACGQARVVNIQWLLLTMITNSNYQLHDKQGTYMMLSEMNITV